MVCAELSWPAILIFIKINLPCHRSLQIKCLVAAVALGLAVVDRSSWESHLSGGSCKVKLQHACRLSVPVVICLSTAFAAKHQSLHAFLCELVTLKDSQWRLQVGSSNAVLPGGANQKKGLRKEKDQPPSYDVKDLPGLASFIRNFRRLSTSANLHVGRLFCHPKKKACSSRGAHT